MSSLWTPGGEHRVPREAPGAAPAAATPPTEEPALSDDEQRAMADAAAEIAQIREQVAAAPPELVVANHVMGLYELAAVHLNQDRPNLDAARLAIDALGGVLDACKGRLGEAESTLTGARSQLQLTFVNVTNWVKEQQPG